MVPIGTNQIPNESFMVFGSLSLQMVRRLMCLRFVAVEFDII